MFINKSKVEKENAKKIYLEGYPSISLDLLTDAFAKFHCIN